MNVFISNFECTDWCLGFFGWGGVVGGDLLFIDLALMFNIGEIILLQYAEPNHF